MITPNRKYRPPETTSGDLDTPVTFFHKSSGGWMPGESEKSKLYFCMAEHYEASIKDYEVVNTTNARFVVTILIPHPREDYIPRYDHWFELENIMYTKGGTTDYLIFNIENIAPHDGNLLKIVGVAYDS